MGTNFTMSYRIGDQNALHYVTMQPYVGSTYLSGTEIPRQNLLVKNRPELGL